MTRARWSYREDLAVPRFDDAHPLFVFDGVCVLCSGGAAWLMRRREASEVRFAAAQSTLGHALYRHYGYELDDSYLLLSNGRVFTASDGYLELARVLGGPWHLLRLGRVVPRPLRDWAYRLVARHRYRWFGKVDHCTLLTPDQRARLIDM